MSHPDPTPPGAAIFGCSATQLSDDERAFFKESDPLGFILFARNIEAPDQVKALVADLRDSVGRAEAPVLIDQEGGRVARLPPPHWREAPPALRFGELALVDRFVAAEAVALNSRLIAQELHALGIDVDCLPLLDIPAPDGHGIIGDRAYGDDPDLVAMLGRAACGGLLAGGVLPVIKHVPGHGRARVDSHQDLPIVEASLDDLTARDFQPFKALSEMPIGMTAHVIYTDIDPDRPATTSSEVISKVIRRLIGFDGLLLTDDIGMSALSGAMGLRARAALAAGCDVVLHCSGKLDEMVAVADSISPLNEAAEDRFRRARKQFRVPEAFDAAAADHHIAELLKVAQA